MTIRYSELPDDIQEIIEGQLEKLREYDDGDLVTVEPTDHDINYAGSWLEGVPLQVSGIEVFRVDINTYTWERAEHYIDRGDTTWDNLVKVEDLDYYRDVLVFDDPDYSFERVDMIMGERSLIEWDQYRENYESNGEIRFPSEKGSSYATRKRTQGSECEVCGSKWYRVQRMESPPGDVHEECAVCGFDPRYETFATRWS